MEKVNWSFITTSSLNGIDHPECVRTLIPENYHPFKNLSKEITRTRKGITYLKCPAHTDFLKNTFVFCAPFDLTINLEVDIQTNSVKIFCENISQDVFNSIVDTRFLFTNRRGKSPYPLIGIDWLPIFTTHTSMLMQLTPAFMHYNDFTQKTTVIPGEYDIGKWSRPVELVFEVRSLKEKIVIKQGDALSYIKFRHDDLVKLEKSETPWDEMNICNSIRYNDQFRPLKERYKALEEIRANKCPYDNTK